MADVETGDSMERSHTLEKRVSHSTSPFYSRAYAGFTAIQEQFYLKQLGMVKGKILFDPMAGQGFLLADLAYQGAEVWLGDINPAMSLIASLRDPSMIYQHKRLIRWAKDRLEQFVPSRVVHRREYVDQWVPPSIRADLESYRSLFELDELSINDNQSIWRLSIRKRFAAALSLLAARELVCFRSSDNRTWSKPGGLQRQLNIVSPIARALSEWHHWAQAKMSSSRRSEIGKLFTQRMDAEQGDFGSAPQADAIVTSPSYANRLDYTRMWAPESEVAAVLWGLNIKHIQAHQMGSNVVRGTGVAANEQILFPKAVADALNAIKNDTRSYASGRYYYPFFRNYAQSLARAVSNLALQTAGEGLLVMFVRDTVRKDVLFPTGALVEGIAAQHGLELGAKERHIVRQHVGLLRRASSNGLYGTAQQEWWLSFRRRRR